MIRQPPAHQLDSIGKDEQYQPDKHEREIARTESLDLVFHEAARGRPHLVEPAASLDFGFIQQGEQPPQPAVADRGQGQGERADKADEVGEQLGDTRRNSTLRRSGLALGRGLLSPNLFQTLSDLLQLLL